jgi:hypothetical protein
MKNCDWAPPRRSATWVQQPIVPGRLKGLRALLTTPIRCRKAQHDNANVFILLTFPFIGEEERCFASLFGMTGWSATNYARSK